MSPMGWLVSAAVLLTLLAGLCASAEAALARVSRVRVQELVAQRRRGSHRLQEMLADAPRSLNVVLLLRVSFELSAVVVVTAAFVKVCSGLVRARVRHRPWRS